MVPLQRRRWQKLETIGSYRSTQARGHGSIGCPTRRRDLAHVAAHAARWPVPGTFDRRRNNMERCCTRSPWSRRGRRSRVSFSAPAWYWWGSRGCGGGVVWRHGHASTTTWPLTTRRNAAVLDGGLPLARCRLCQRFSQEGATSESLRWLIGAAEVLAVDVRFKSGLATSPAKWARNSP